MRKTFLIFAAASLFVANGPRSTAACGGFWDVGCNVGHGLSDVGAAVGTVGNGLKGVHVSVNPVPAGTSSGGHGGMVDEPAQPQPLIRSVVGSIGAKVAAELTEAAGGSKNDGIPRLEPQSQWPPNFMGPHGPSVDPNDNPVGDAPTREDFQRMEPTIVPNAP